MLFLAFAPSYTRAQAPAMNMTPGTERTPALIVTELRSAKTRAQTDALEKELLSKGGAAVKPMIELMADHKGQDRIMVMIMNLGAKAPPALVALLPDDKLRSDAARALAHATGSYSAGQAAELLACLSKYPDVKHACGIALVRGMSSKEGRWVPRLTVALKSGDRDERLYAALALKQIGLKAPGVREALMTVVSDSDDEIRQVVRSTGLRPVPKPVVKPVPKAGPKAAAKGVKAK